MVDITIKCKYNFEALFRLTLHYNNLNFSYSKIEDYMIQKRNSEYLIELYFISDENQLNIQKSLTN